MKPSLQRKIERLAERIEELDALLAEPSVIERQDQFRTLSREHAEISPVVACFRRLRLCDGRLAEARGLLEEPDVGLRALAQEELKAVEAEQRRLEEDLTLLLLPRDPADDSNLFLEVRAGTGGDEAALFAGDLLRMYTRYAEARGWRTELVSESPSELGGYREVILRIIGQGAYSRLKFESGAHRVQRVPVTESQGRIHTSACTIAILPEADDITHIDINPADLRVDTYRASGAGGQHVNKTDSAIRITHLPSGTVVECQDERSQHKNRARAMSLLKARLLSAERERQASAEAATRRRLVGSGDRSERIRTYNFPQGRVTDHRINLTLHRLEDILQGEIDGLIEPLIQEHRADLMAELGEDAA